MSEPVENREPRLAPGEDLAQPDSARQEPASQQALYPQAPGFEKALSEMIEKEVARRFQSAKDKRWSALEKIYGDLHELSEQAQASVPTPETDTSPEETPLDYAQQINALADLPGIRENEDALALILRNQNPADQNAYTTLVEDLLRAALGTKEATTPAAVSAASVVIPGGGEVPNDLEQAYQRRKKLLRPGDVNALTTLKREFRQKGLDIF
ncbi:hypothetical protein KQH61_03940 [bacterium]|nr:hypothetical protein [bacterium]MCB2179054.1 hypothetical protein [bacterium]